MLQCEVWPRRQIRAGEHDGLAARSRRSTANPNSGVAIIGRRVEWAIGRRASVGSVRARIDSIIPIGISCVVPVGITVAVGAGRVPWVRDASAQHCCQEQHGNRDQASSRRGEFRISHDVILIFCFCDPRTHINERVLLRRALTASQRVLCRWGATNDCSRLGIYA